MTPESPEEKLRRALLIIQKLQARVSELEAAAAEPIAVIGMGCRLPGGAADPESFWQLLMDRRDAVGDIPPGRLDRPVDAKRFPGAGWAGLLDDDALQMFEPLFFGVSPREAVSLDPRQRMLLETSWEALENAGQPPDSLAEKSVGVFLSVYNNEYLDLAKTRLDPVDFDVYWGTGNGNHMSAGRIAFVLGLQGPALVVDTACSSSLVAVHLAVQSLRDRDCDLALVGGASVILSAGIMEGVASWHAFAPDGRCKTFDAAANGFVRGEGCGMVVLKRLRQAQHDGDPIRAVIRGTAVNNDGRSSGLTAPNVLSQQALLRSAIQHARISPEAYGFIETHGTGTVLGDPIELEALKAVVGKPRTDGSACWLGAVKTNLGHAEAAAGIAGLIKVVLALQHQTIPPNLHFESLNPMVDLRGTPFAFPTEAQTWPRGASPRVAGVSSFGFSGTNAHVVVEEAPAVPAATGPTRPWHLLVLSARDEAAL
ncbi:MAG TPA: polyketide synthase, partial [Candidatus Xenobia bacterium]